MTSRAPCSARFLVPLLVLISCLSLSRAFRGVIAPTRVGRMSTSGRGPTTTRGVRSSHGNALGGVSVGLPRRTSAGLRSTAEDDVQGGAGDGGDDEGSGIFSGVRRWWKRDGKSDLQIYGTSLVFALFVRTVALEPRFIPSLSMYPTFEIGDQLAVDKLSVRFARPYQRKDVVVFHPPPKFSEFSNRGKDEALIKRVIAVDGDTVEIKEGALFVNGERQFEEYTFEEPEYKWGPQTVSEGMVMVLGDNRNHSLDSHVWGFLPKENVIGRAVFKYWPPWRVGLVEN